MNSIQLFKNELFIHALKAFFEELEVPVNYIDELPASPRDILGEKYNSQNPVHALIDDVYVLGLVSDEAFKKQQKVDLNELRVADYQYLLILGITLKTDRPTRGQLAEISRIANYAFNTNEKGNPVTIVFKYGNLISSHREVVLKKITVSPAMPRTVENLV